MSAFPTIYSAPISSLILPGMIRIPTPSERCFDDRGRWDAIEKLIMAISGKDGELRQCEMAISAHVFSGDMGFFFSLSLQHLHQQG